MKITHLHAHTTFSFLDGYGNPKQLANRILELGHNACGITDHGNILSHVPVGQAYIKSGIKPIYGCEFYICDSIEIRNKMHSPTLGYDCLPHITVLAQSQKGYSNLLKLSRASWELGFYTKPRIDHEMLIRHQEGLIVLSGCPTGYPTRLIGKLGYEAAVAHMSWLRKYIEQYYVELVPQPGWDVSINAAPQLWRASLELQIPMVITADAHFPRPTDYKYQDALLAVGTRQMVDAQDRAIRLPDYQYYCSAEELLERTCAVLPNVDRNILSSVIQNSFYISESCEVEMKRATPVSFPDKPDNMTSGELLWKWVVEGATKRYNEGSITKENWNKYMERAQYEFVTLNEKGFCDYILVIADVIRWMKDQDALIMVRGSAGGCLLLWMMGASATDPILHDLSFERFYDATRPDPPDVDIDFEQARRAEAIEYIYEKYGRANCSQIAALSQLRPKSAIQDAAFALGIHRRQFAALSDALSDNDMDLAGQFSRLIDPKAIAVLESFPRLGELAIGMVGQYRQQSVHAAGVLVSSAPLEDIIGVIVSDGKPVAAVDKYGAASLGYLKIDMLSVSAMDIVGMAARKIAGNVAWLEKLPLNDENVFKTARDMRLSGIFQIDGASARKVLKEIGCDSFEDIVAASVLCRPGASDSVPIYKRHKYDADAFAKYLASIHPLVADIIRPTFGVLMYQEQVQRIAREVAGLEWKLVHRLRKEVAAKLGLDKEKGDAWRAEWKSLFITGAMTHSGMSQAEADYWWAAIEHHGGYSFNKSHGLTYGVNGYWMLYLKTYYPAQFYEAYLKLEKDDDVKKRLLIEFRKSGGNIEILNPRLSGVTFSTAGSNTLIGGYSDLKYVGEISAEKVYMKAPFSSESEMINALPKRARDMYIALRNVGEMDPALLLDLVPWMPIPAMLNADIDMMEQVHVSQVSILGDQRTDGDVVVAGYVSNTDFTSDKVIFTLEDDTVCVTCRIAANQLKAIGPRFRELKVGDFIAVKGWWTGDTMFAKAFAPLRMRPRK